MMREKRISKYLTKSVLAFVCIAGISSFFYLSMKNSVQFQTKSISSDSGDNLIQQDLDERAKSADGQEKDILSSLQELKRLDAELNPQTNGEARNDKGSKEIEILCKKFLLDEFAAQSIQATFNTLGFSLADAMESCTEIEDERYNEPLIQMHTTNGTVLQFQPHSGMLHALYAQFPEVPEGLLSKDAISVEAALTSMRDFIGKLKLDIAISSDDIIYDSTVLDDELVSTASWSAIKCHEYGGFKIPECNIAVDVSAYTGEIIHFFHYSLEIPPTTMEVTVDSTKATEIAKAFIIQKGFGKNSVLRWDPSKLFFIYPTNYWYRSPADRPKREKIPRLCWPVSFIPENIHTGPTVIVYVDAATGEIMGGMG